MITVYNFGPQFGLPDPSPFCMKAMVQIKMAGQRYERKDCDPRKAPKGKAPFITDDGQTIADTSFIRWYLENKYGVDLDDGLSPAERGVAWAFEKLCEDNIYWAIMHERWMVDANFDAGPKNFFNSIPGLVRPLVIKTVRGQIKRDLKGQGFGRHSRDEIVRLANRGINAIADFLGEKPFLMGGEPCSADAMTYSTVAGVLCEHFDTEMLANAKSRQNLIAYRDRCQQRWFADF